MTLLDTVQNVAAAVNTTIPTAIVGSSNADARQWLALANRAGKEVARRHDWTILVTEGSFVSTATVEQSDVLDNLGNFDHFVPDVVLWNQTQSVPLIGPVSSNEWQTLINSGVSGGSSGWWRRTGGGNIEITPAPTAGETFVFEYVTNTWCFNPIDLVDNAEWLTDANEGRISEELIELNLTWRWLRAHGLDYAEELATYEREIEKAAARDRGIQVMTLERRSGANYSWPGTIVP